MNLEAQRIAIAEACGWKQVIEQLFNIQQMSWMRPGDKENHGFRPPDYLNNLNAMHEAEEVLNEKQLDSMRDFLSDTWLRDNPDRDTIRVWHSTAPQRAEAFLRTLGLWKDDACTRSEISTTANH